MPGDPLKLVGRRFLCGGNRCSPLAAVHCFLVDCLGVYQKGPILVVGIMTRSWGRNLIDFADLVAEMHEIKHLFQEQDIRARAGIEY